MARQLTNDGVNAIPPLGLVEQEAAAPELIQLPPEPARSGSGATRDAWATYASELGLEYGDDATRGDLIALVDEYVLSLPTVEPEPVEEEIVDEPDPELSDTEPETQTEETPPLTELTEEE